MTFGIRKPLPKPAPVVPFERWNLVDINALAAPLAPVPWVCQPFGLAPGFITLVAGYGYSGKTMALQSLAVSVASGCSVWGVWSCRKGRVLHLDYEQGLRLNQDRYQRLARGMGFELRDLPVGTLTVACLPRVYLDENGLQDELVKLVEGYTLVIVDSLRAAFPHADENSSEVRSYLDILSRVSERTGATFIVIHHARKPNGPNGGGAKYAIRGSSALFDAGQSVFIFEGEKNEPTRVVHDKDRIRGKTIEDFGLVTEDIAGETGPNHALIVRHLDGEQLEQGSSNRSQQAETKAVREVAKKIVTTLIENKGFRGTRTELRAVIRAKTALFDSAWAQLLNMGAIVRSGSSRDPVWMVNEHAEPSR